MRLKFGEADTCHLHKPKSVAENLTYTINWDFEIQSDHRNSTKRQELILINTKMRECHPIFIHLLTCQKLKQSNKEMFFHRDNPNLGLRRFREAYISQE